MLKLVEFCFGHPLAGSLSLSVCLPGPVSYSSGISGWARERIGKALATALRPRTPLSFVQHVLENGPFSSGNKRTHCPPRRRRGGGGEERKGRAQRGENLFLPPVSGRILPLSASIKPFLLAACPPESLANCETDKPGVFPNLLIMSLGSFLCACANSHRHKKHAGA